MQEKSVISIEYNDLVNGNIDWKNIIEQSFGFGGLGILIVANVPKIDEMRAKTLPLIKKFAELPAQSKEIYEYPDTYYSVGWSHGKEKMKKDTPDIMKGSFYFNPEYNLPFGEEMEKKYPLFCHRNVWPDDIIPNFGFNVMVFSKIIIDIGKKILVACDEYINSVYPEHYKTKLLDIAGNSKVNKGRLLHYYPINDITNNKDLWCGIHNDHGFLTGLVSSMYLDPNYNEVVSPDSSCGLYIKSRNGSMIKVSIPTNGLAFQIGESACIYSGGLLQATPHVVVAPNTPESIGITRETMAIFFSAQWDALMEKPMMSDYKNIFRGSLREYLPDDIPLLEKRWTNGMTYQDFSDLTYKSYYG